MSYTLLGLAFIIIIFLIALYPMVMERTKEDVTIRIPANATISSISDTLTKHYGKDFASRVIRLLKIRNIDFTRRHGSYLVPSGSNALTAMRRIGYGGQTPLRITINGFRDLDLLCERVAGRLDFPADSLLAALSDPAILRPYGLVPGQALALFLDDTYEIYWTATPRDLIKKVGSNYLSYWDAAHTQKAAALGLTPAQVVTVASIADEETNKADEKGVIGRLYINRLDKKMRLQADPTVRFSLKDFSIRRVRAEHLKTDSPYNTYLHAGLPPGPIRTTSRATLDAILDSEPNNYLYMCAKDDFSGSHNFASTFAEHTQNARRYQKALNDRGIH